MIRVPGLALLSLAFAGLGLAFSPTALAQQGQGSVGVPDSSGAPVPQAPKAVPATPAPKAETSAKPPKEDTSSEEMPPEVTGEPKISRQGIGNDPGALEYGGLALAPTGESQLTTNNIKANQINFHGFLRAPLRIGLGEGPPGFSGLKLHSPPRVPDSAYTEWSYTNNLGGPWTELHLSYGNAKVFANVKLAAYNLTDDHQPARDVRTEGRDPVERRRVQRPLWVAGPVRRR